MKVQLIMKKSVMINGKLKVEKVNCSHITKLTGIDVG